MRGAIHETMRPVMSHLLIYILIPIIDVSIHTQSGIMCWKRSFSSGLPPPFSPQQPREFRSPFFSSWSPPPVHDPIQIGWPGSFFFCVKILQRSPIYNMYWYRTWFVWCLQLIIKGDIFFIAAAVAGQHRALLIYVYISIMESITCLYGLLYQTLYSSSLFFRALPCSSLYSCRSTLISPFPFNDNCLLTRVFAACP